MTLGAGSRLGAPDGTVPGVSLRRGGATPVHDGAARPSDPALSRPCSRSVADEQSHRQASEQPIDRHAGDVGDDPLASEQVAPGAVG
jgi:hypothetical protein